MRHNTAYTFTNEERNLLANLLLKEMNNIAYKYGYNPETITGMGKDKYIKTLYNLYLQF